MSFEEQLTQKLSALPAILANAAVNWTLTNFSKQQWDGTAWKPLSSRTIKQKKAGGSILVGKGRGNLRRSIQVVTSESGTGLSSAFGSLGIPYARIHNQGGTITHPARTRKLTLKNIKAGNTKAKPFFIKIMKKPASPKRPKAAPTPSTSHSVSSSAKPLN